MRKITPKYPSLTTFLPLSPFSFIFLDNSLRMDAHRGGIASTSAPGEYRPRLAVPTWTFTPPTHSPLSLDVWMTHFLAQETTHPYELPPHLPPHGTLPPRALSVARAMNAIRALVTALVTAPTPSPHPATILLHPSGEMSFSSPTQDCPHSLTTVHISPSVSPATGATLPLRVPQSPNDWPDPYALLPPCSVAAHLGLIVADLCWFCSEGQYQPESDSMMGNKAEAAAADAQASGIGVGVNGGDEMSRRRARRRVLCLVGAMRKAGWHVSAIPADGLEMEAWSSVLAAAHAYRSPWDIGDEMSHPHLMGVRGKPPPPPAGQPPHLLSLVSLAQALLEARPAKRQSLRLLVAEHLGFPTENGATTDQDHHDATLRVEVVEAKGLGKGSPLPQLQRQHQEGKGQGGSGSASPGEREMIESDRDAAIMGCMIDALTPVVDESHDEDRPIPEMGPTTTTSTTPTPYRISTVRSAHHVRSLLGHILAQHEDKRREMEQSDRTVRHVFALLQQRLGAAVTTTTSTPTATATISSISRALMEDPPSITPPPTKRRRRTTTPTPEVAGVVKDLRVITSRPPNTTANTTTTTATNDRDRIATAVASRMAILNPIASAAIEQRVMDMCLSHAAGTTTTTTTTTSTMIATTTTTTTTTTTASQIPPFASFTTLATDMPPLTLPLGENSPQISTMTTAPIGPLVAGRALIAATQYRQLSVMASLRQGDVKSMYNVTRSMALDRDESWLATVGTSKRLKIFSLSSILHDDLAFVHYPRIEFTCRAKLSSVAWNPYVSGQLAVANYDGVVQLYDANTGQELTMLEEHTERAWTVDFCPSDPTLMVSGSDDRSVKWWNIRSEDAVATVNLPAPVSSVRFFPTSRHLVVAGCADASAYLLDLRKTDEPLERLVGHRRALSYVTFVGPSDRLATASIDASLMLWDLGATRRRIRAGTVSSNAPTTTVLRPSPKNATSCSSRRIGVYRGHQNAMNFVGLATTTSGYLLTGSEDNRVYAYHTLFPEPILSCPLDQVGRHPYGYGPPGTASSEVSRVEAASPFVSALCWSEKQQVCMAANSLGQIHALSFTS